jgi:hypothetical protein
MSLKTKGRCGKLGEANAVPMREPSESLGQFATPVGVGARHGPPPEGFGPQGGVPLLWGARSRVARRGKKNSFLNERTGNVIENKGPLWKTRERSGNVVENKGAPRKTLSFGCRRRGGSRTAPTMALSGGSRADLGGLPFRELNERNGNVYENKRRGQKVEESRS